ncbi:MAG: hypothetical protein HZA77_10520 [Candidatus Schekmanbacteria bacterium]|nr:hypothetical protein [Candidatus Schekmanbacteria bacterium]
MTDKDKRYKYAFRAIKSSQLWRALEKFKKHYLDTKNPDFLVIPYILTCAAYLESKLNDSFHDTEKQYGNDFSYAMMSLSLPNKLKVLVPVLTNGKFVINKEHFVYQRLISLIRVRNTIAHAKSELKEITANEDEVVNEPIMNSGIHKIPKHFLNDTNDITLGASKTFTPLEYHEALDKFKKWFFLRYPDKLSEVPMLIERSKIPQWEEQTRTFVKYMD